MRGLASSQSTRVRGHSERLAARAQAGDREAQRLLVEEHMPLVRSLAARYRGLGTPVEDLVQDGVVGLLKAIGDFDPRRGASFSTHAFWRARSEMTHALTARGHVVRVPRPLLERRRRIADVRHEIAVRGQPPTVKALAEASGLAPEEVEEVLAMSLEVESLDTAPSNRALRIATLADDADIATDVAAAAHDDAVAEAVARLPAREREIVQRHFGLGRPPQPLEEIASELELSPSRTRALRDSALHELRSALEPARSAA